jgi:hypothetical protein
MIADHRFQAPRTERSFQYVIIAISQPFSPDFSAGIARILGRRYIRKERSLAESLKKKGFLQDLAA